MNHETALRFLKANQPLPSDTDLSQSTINKFDEVRRFFSNNPDPLSVKLLLNIFGDGDGLGTYKFVEDTLLQQDRATVVSELLHALGSPHRSVRYWCAQIASSFPDAKIATALMKLLHEEDFDIKYAALTALEQAHKFISEKEIINYEQDEKNTELKTLAEEIIKNISRT